MAKISVKRFVELLQKSKLVRDTVLRNALVQLKKENHDKPLADTDFVTRRLTEMDLVTPWQCEKLLDQKYKGFFLGKYKILKHIGTGGMSSVYLVKHLQMHQRRAIKVLPRKRVSDKTYLERFYIEARVSAALEHPNIVRAIDVDHDEETNTHYLIMEYVDGQDIGKIIKEKGPIQHREAASFIAQAADALQFAHDQGIIHRDVKPGNVLIDNNNEVKILDMGLALFQEDEYSVTLEYNEKVLGTADYLAPEQAMNSHNVDHRADIYGLGCTLYFMLAGQPPFNEGSLAQRIVKHQTQSPEPITNYRKDCPLGLQRILGQMMHKDPEKRIQNCSEVSRLCRHWLAGKPINLTAKIDATTGGEHLGEITLTPGDSNVLHTEIHPENQEAGALQEESLKTSADDTIGKSASPPTRSPKSAIRRSAVSFSDIVAGSEVHSSASNPQEPGAKPKQAGNKRTIEISPILLLTIILISVFASSVFTVLVLYWRDFLGG
ncbi:MAG: serine/threonine-protein kinase [Planctomycetota bacterium]|nr:serine/threonine-protein kinase [Planctomycetota bacterium]